MPHYLSYDRIVGELLPRWWIDGRPRAVDACRTSVLIALRNPRSAWSAVSESMVATVRGRCDDAVRREMDVGAGRSHVRACPEGQIRYNT